MCEDIILGTRGYGDIPAYWATRIVLSTTQRAGNMYDMFAAREF